MGPLTALVLATPIFGFALQAPTVEALPSSIAPAAQLAAAEDMADGAALSEAVASGLAPTVNPDLSSNAALPAVSSLGVTSMAASSVDQAAYVAQLRKRAKIAKVHRTMGIATWGLTAVAVIAGTIQYRNLYGAPFGADRDHNPCVEGNAFPRQQACFGTPWFHAITGFAAGAFYFTTLGLAVFMPDPDHASEGKSKFAKTLKTHKILRWVHLAAMVSQMVLGIIIANPGVSGLDRANDYDTLKLLSGIHLASGYIALGALSWAGTIMLL
jgi:hypothetical protein